MNKSPQFHIINTLAQALTEVFTKEKNADRMIDKYMRANPKWTPAEKKFFAESLYEIVRHKRLLAYLTESEDNFKLIGAYLLNANYKLLPRAEFAGLEIAKIKERLRQNKSAAIEYSFPDWLYEIGNLEFGKEWPAIMQALNRAPEVFLRCNNLKSNIQSLIADLKIEDFKVDRVRAFNKELPDTLVLKERKSIFHSKAFKMGAFEMQDAGSQMIAPLLAPQPGEIIADTCAGSGGKTLHLASLMNNKGKVVAMDIYDWKLKDLHLRAQRAGASIIETKLLAHTKVLKQFEKTFDRVLIDAPCSGLGVLRRNPDTKWKMSLEEISRLVKLQKEILTQYSEICKVGGVLVYATCSLLKRENEEQVSSFLNSSVGKKWKLTSEIRLWPHLQGFDGFYAAVLQRQS